MELPYIGRKSKQMVRELRRIIEEHCLHVKPAFFFKCQRRIRSFFPLKDSVPVMMKSDVIYKYTCDCSQSYIGSTTVNLYIRISQHRGLSFRTGKALTRPPNSSIRDHTTICGNIITPDNFSIVDKYPEESGLRILESLYIKRTRPRINECNTAVSLCIW